MHRHHWTVRGGGGGGAASKRGAEEKVLSFKARLREGGGHPTSGGHLM